MPRGMRVADRLAPEARLLLGLAWPVMLTSLNWTILHVTDVAMVGLVGTEQVAILGGSRALTFITIVAALGWMSGIMVFTARADGADDLPETGQVLRDGLVLALALGATIGAAMAVFAAPMLGALGVAPALLADTAHVVRLFAIAFPFQLIMIAISFFLEGVSRPARVTIVNFSILPINAVLAWSLSGGHLGLPALGAGGAALATAIASALGAIGMIIAAWTLPKARARGLRDLRAAAWVAAPRRAWRLCRFGAVPAIASGLELAGFSILIALSTQLGPATAHAFQIVFSVHNVTFSVAMGLGSAAGVRVGNAIGEGVVDQARRRTLIAAGLTAAMMAMLALLLIVAARPIIAIFPATDAVRDLALAMLPLWAGFILFDGIQLVFVYALRSIGDQVAAGINSIIAYFIVTGGLGVVLVAQNWGATGLVLASGSGMLVAALLSGLRFERVSRRSRTQS
ncbi:MATE family efflux transporter [Sphingomonas aquatica]|uniref:MATE family efflux transporter n=2 Tax=Sphingomonas TaxID=13687 RepID=UPI00301E41DE